jgi:hypothetical protein
MKKCRKCFIEHPINSFPKGRAQCSSCRKKANAEWRENNKRYIKKKDKEKWIKFKSNPENLKKRKDWYLKNKETILKGKKDYYESNKASILEAHKKYERKKLKTDPLFRFQKNIRRRVLAAFKNSYKIDTTKNLIGCSWQELREHLEKQFKEGMTWENYGEWHIDHIIPLSLFDLSKEEAVKKAIHFSNLQPLWAEDNLKKGNRIIQ